VDSLESKLHKVRAGDWQLDVSANKCSVLHVSRPTTFDVVYYVDGTALPNVVT